MLNHLNVKWATVADAALAFLLFAVGLWEVLVEPFSDGVVGGPVVLDLATVSCATLPLAFRRTAPLPVLGVVFGAIGVRVLAPEPLEIYPPILAGLVATYSVAVHASTAQALAGLVIAIVSVEVMAARGTGSDASPDPIAAPILLAAVWVVGWVAASRHARAQAIEHQAAERDRRRADAERAAVALERRRIARELHDAVSHSLALIAMQASGAEAILARDPERAAGSLRAIERAAREGLTEMRRLLGVMEGGEPDAELSPRPGIDRIDALVEGARDAGLSVALRCEGEPRRVPPAVDASVYRIVQEALTNAARHAGRCKADVALRWHRDAIEIEVINDGTSPVADSRELPGRGLIGMRERAALVGGQLEAGPRGDGCYRVFALLPLEASV